MSEIPSLVQDLAVILIVAGIVTLLFKKLKQPLVLGYIMAGFLVSPHMPLLPLAVDKENIQSWADIGVMFLLFSLGPASVIVGERLAARLAKSEIQVVQRSQASPRNGGGAFFLR